MRRRDRLLARLKPGAAIGMDGVFAMQPYYAKGGFVFSHRDMRFRAEIPARPATPDADICIVPLAEVPFDQLATYDRTCFPAPRPAFLKQWISQPDALALGYVQEGALAGYGVVRRCGEGCKIGPLFADDAAVAEALYTHLAMFAAGGPLYLDAPENNPHAMALVAAARHGRGVRLRADVSGPRARPRTCAHLRCHDLRAGLRRSRSGRFKSGSRGRWRQDGRRSASACA